MKNLKLSRPIPDKKIYNFIKDSISGESLYSDLREDYCNSYSSWIQSTKVNNLEGLDSFKSIQYSYGTTESFDTFNLNNIKKRMRCFKGDFIYHTLSWKRNFDWLYMEDDDIRENDAVIVSVPFSDFGDIHPQTNDVLDRCDELGVPVFIDCAYFSVCRNLNFDLDRPCIRGVSFSMSKAFYGTERLRIGLRCKKISNDDPVDVFYKHGYGLKNFSRGRV